MLWLVFKATFCQYDRRMICAVDLELLTRRWLDADMVDEMAPDDSAPNMQGSCTTCNTRGRLIL